MYIIGGVNYEIKEAVIETKHRMSYTNVNKIIDNDVEIKEKYKDIVNDVILMNKVAHILSNKRAKNGALNFEIPEAKIIVDEKGYPIEAVIESLMTIINSNYEQWHDSNPEKTYHLEILTDGMEEAKYLVTVSFISSTILKCFSSFPSSFFKFIVCNNPAPTKYKAQAR